MKSSVHAPVRRITLLAQLNATFDENEKNWPDTKLSYAPLQVEML